ncbi:MAG: serine hydrolase [Gammaproteobacteria bacterium]|nr:MAG: serine hydrolase [Gammaproteobacteria bacterium]
MSERRRPSRVASLAARRIQQRQFASLAWRIDVRGETVDAGDIGWRDHAESVAMTGGEIYRIYSMTKPVVSFRILQLIEAGRLALDSPVGDWMPGFDRMSVLRRDGRTERLQRRITVEDLLTHRAGLSYDFLPDCPLATLYREAHLVTDASRSLSELVQALAEYPLAFQPGERWYYSYATDVLGHLIEYVCDRPLDEDLEQALFAPLGMVDTAFHVPDDKRARLVAMYGGRGLGEPPTSFDTRNELTPVDVEDSHPSDRRAGFLRGGFGLFSTIDDYCLFIRIMKKGVDAAGREYLGSELVDCLWQNRLPAAQRPLHIYGDPYSGYGWGLAGRIMVDIDEADVVTVPGEGGWSGAASTWFWIDRANDTSGVIMTQFLGSSVAIGAQMQSAFYMEDSGAQG